MILWSVFSFTLAGWVGLGLVAGLFLPRNQESRMRLSLFLVHDGRGIQR